MIDFIKHVLIMYKNQLEKNTLAPLNNENTETKKENSKNKKEENNKKIDDFTISSNEVLRDS